MTKFDKKPPRTSPPAPRRRMTPKAVRGFPFMGTPKARTTTRRVVADWRRAKRLNPKR